MEAEILGNIWMLKKKNHFSKEFSLHRKGYLHYALLASVCPFPPLGVKFRTPAQQRTDSLLLRD